MRYARILVFLGVLAGVALGAPREAETFSVDTAIPVSPRPQNVAVNAVTHRVYVTHDTPLPSNSLVTVIDSLTNSVVTTIGVGLTASDIAVNPVTNRIYVANSDSDSVSVIDGGCNCVVATVPAGDNVDAVAVNPVANRFYSGSREGGSSGQVITYNGSTNATICSVTLANHPISGIAVNPNTNRVYASSWFEGGRGAIIDGNTCGILFNNLSVCGWGSSRQLVYNPADNRFYGTTYNTGRVGGYNADTGAVERCIDLGSGAFEGGWGADIGIEQQLLYATSLNNSTQRLYRVDLENGTVLDFIDPGINLNGIGVDQETCHIYVANHQNNQVWVAEDDLSDCDGVPDPPDNCPNDNNPDQSDIDSQDGGDVCDVCPSDATDACDPNRSAGTSIGPVGGTLTTPDGSTTVTIPPGCFTTDTSVSITGSTGTDFELTTNLGNAKALFSVNIQPSGLTCDNGEPFTIVFSWDDAAPNDDRVDGTSPPIREDNLRITKNNVVLFGTTKCHDVAHPPPAPTLTTPSCDHAANIFTFQVSSFSDFSPVAPVDTDEDDVPDDFDGQVDNCPDTPNLDQANADGDQWGDACEIAECVAVFTVWVTPVGDEDCDGWTTADEDFYGTLPLTACPATAAMDDEDPDSWAPDFNDSRNVNIIDLVGVPNSFKASFGATDPNPNYFARFDLSMDGSINILDLVGVPNSFKSTFGLSCT
jgi:YVTN family beta-propeller protein